MEYRRDGWSTSSYPGLQEGNQRLNENGRTTRQKSLGPWYLRATYKPWTTDLSTFHVREISFSIFLRYYNLEFLVTRSHASPNWSFTTYPSGNVTQGTGLINQRSGKDFPSGGSMAMMLLKTYASSKTWNGNPTIPLPTEERRESDLILFHFLLTETSRHHSVFENKITNSALLQDCSYVSLEELPFSHLFWWWPHYRLYWPLCS